MGRVYTVPWTGTVTAAGGDTDLWEFLPAANKPIILRGFTLGETTEVGDAAEEGLRITIRHMAATVTSGSGGATPTISQLPIGSSKAAGFTSEVNNTTVATTSGTSTIVEEMSWINRNSPFEKWYPEEKFCHGAINTEGLFIRMETTLADDMTFCGTAWVEETGG